MAAEIHNVMPCNRYLLLRWNVGSEKVLFLLTNSEFVKA